MIHERIQQKLDELGLKQADIARATKKSTPAVAKWLSGQNIPKTNSLVVISQLLGVSQEWLLTGKDNNGLSSKELVELDTLAERLKYIRNLRNLSQKEIADRLNVAQSTYCRIENGLTEKADILEISNALNINPIWLATGQGDIYQDNNPILDNKIQHIINYPSATISKKQHLPLTDLLLKQSDDLDNLFTTSIIGDDMNPILGHLSMVVVDRNKLTLPIISGMIYAIGFDDRILCRYLRQNINNTIQIYSELDKQGESLPTDEFFDRYQIMGGVIQHIQSYQWQ